VDHIEVANKKSLEDFEEKYFPGYVRPRHQAREV